MIPVSDPRAQAQHFDAEIRNALDLVCRGGQYVLGAELEALEAEFAEFCGATFCVGVANGTDAIALALRALDVNPGDEVITVSLTAVATVAAIEMVGAKPILVDVDPVHYTMSPSSLRSAITHRTRAVIPVHLYGQPSDMGEIARICKPLAIPIVEDCSQAHGAVFRGQRVGSIGTVGAFSCYPTKNLGALGDAGLLTTSDAGIATRLRALRQYGWEERNWSLEPGVNSRLDEIQAAILRVKLGHLDSMNARRSWIAETYRFAFAELPLIAPAVRTDSQHAWHLFVVSLDNREQIRGKLSSMGVATAVHYPFPIHQQPAYADRLGQTEPLYITEQLSRTVLSLPLFPELSDEQVDTVISATLKSFQK